LHRKKFLKIFSMRFFVVARRIWSLARLELDACKNVTNDGRQQRVAQKTLFFSMKMRGARRARLIERSAWRGLASRPRRASEAESTPAS